MDEGLPAGNFITVVLSYALAVVWTIVELVTRCDACGRRACPGHSEGSP